MRAFLAQEWNDRNGGGVELTGRAATAKSPIKLLQELGPPRRLRRPRLGRSGCNCGRSRHARLLGVICQRRRADVPAVLPSPRSCIANERGSDSRPSRGGPETGRDGPGLGRTLVGRPEGGGGVKDCRLIDGSA